ncbi:MAG: urease accessory protein UreE [Pseudomonadota bacterium]
MRRATGIIATGTPDDHIALPYTERYRRRGVLKTAAGEDILLDLAEAQELGHGTCLTLEDGSQIAIHALAEPLLEVRAANPHHLTRLAWHLGNRHLPVAIQEERLLIQPDSVIEAMLVHLGAQVSAVNEPFSPEGGAYGLGRTHAHSHGHADHDPNAHIPARRAPTP